jgi:hypothetical protein
VLEGSKCGDRDQIYVTLHGGGAQTQKRRGRFGVQGAPEFS